MIKRLKTFFKNYLQFGLVLLSVLLALILGLAGQHTAANIVLIASALTNSVPLVWGMIQDLRMGKYGVDILAATAIITSVLLKEYWAGMIIVLMLTGGEALEDYAENRAKTELNALLKRVPQKAHLLRGRKVVDVAVSSVQVGDKIVIKPGEQVPVDAEILEGTSSFDESSITGESLPIERNKGEELLSGSINLDGAITARALRIASESQFEQIIKLVKSATSSKSPFVRLADRYSIPFTIISFAIAIAAWVYSDDSMRFLQVIVVATPCPLILGAPIAIISGMSRAAKHGIIIKTGSALERLAVIKTMGFDKTGTLTKGQPIVEQVITYNKHSVNEVLSFTAALEQSSNHVLAKAIVDKAHDKKIAIPKAKDIQELTGNGLRATIKGKDILVGRLSLLSKHKVSIPKNKPNKIKQTAAYIAIDGTLAGAITFKDELRPESKQTLSDLKNLGVKHILMVTGDNNDTAKSIASKLGIDSVTAEALPADKIHAVETAPNRPVGFVGDGVNDAPVLAASDVGIALGARGSTAASESADVVIMLDSISQVATSVSISKRTLFIAKQSIMIGIVISVGLMLIFATGKFKPVYGALVQEIVDVIVIFNALRAHGSWRQKKLVTTQPATN